LITIVVFLTQLRGRKNIYQPQKTIELNVKVSDLAFYDGKIKDWNIEAGGFVLKLSDLSANIKCLKVLRVVFLLIK
jgi:hypothetical protein